MSELGPAAPQTIAAGRYQVRGLLGQGGMAAVYRVYDTRLRVECAIKVMAPEYSAKGDLRRRFESEAATMARLRHTNIAAVYDIGDDNGSPYLVMELVGGGSLNDHLNTYGPLPARLAADVTIAVLTALQLAHDSGVVHRDIKPHNVLISRDGVAKVTDFGIARVQEDDSPSMTRTGSVMGTWAYMAPEQRAGSRLLDRRADIYSTGAMLVDLLTGEAPADVFMCEMHKHMLDGVPAPLRPVIERAVRYAPAERYGSAMEMVAALRETLGELPDLPSDHPKLGTLTLPTTTLSPSSSSPRDATYSLDDEDGQPPPASSAPPPTATLHPGGHTLVGGTRVPEPDSAPPPALVPAPGARRLLPAIGAAAALVAVIAVGGWFLSGRDPGGDPGASVPPPPAEAPAAAPPAAVDAQPLIPAPSPTPVEPPPGPPPDVVPAPASAVKTPVARPNTAATTTALAPAPVEVKPAALPPEPAPTAAVAPANASVKVTGDADSITLVGSAGRFPPGDVPPGTYTIEAAFAGGAAAPAGKLTLSPGQSVTVKCVSDFARCK